MKSTDPVTTTPPSPGFRLRPFVSFVVLLGFVVLVASGAVLFVAPPGRVANWTLWKVGGMTKHDWGDLHIVFAAVFLLGGLAHAWLNWRPLLSYLRTRAAARRRVRPEWIVALVLAVGVWVGTRARVAPVASLLAWSERWRQSWEDTKQQAPVPHAELLTLGELAGQAGVPMETAIQRLTLGAEGRPALTNVVGEAEVRALASQAGITPARLYDLVRGDTGAVRAASRETGHGGAARGGGGGGGGGGGSGGGGGGFGPGQKTLVQFCADEGLDLGVVEARLKARGLKVSTNRPLRELARDNGYDRPFELMAIIRER